MNKTETTAPHVHTIELLEHLGSAPDSLEFWQVECSCGWTETGVSKRAVTGWWGEHVREMEG